MGSATKNGETNSGENLQQIREILFGSQSRDIESRFQAIGDQLAESMGGLRTLVRERTDAIAQKLDREVKALHLAVEELRQNNKAQAAGLEQKIHQTENELRQSIGSLTESLSTTERALRNDTESGLKDLKSALTSQMSALQQRVDQDLEKASRTKVSKRSFRDALIELSSHFDDEPQE